MQNMLSVSKEQSRSHIDEELKLAATGRIDMMKHPEPVIRIDHVTKQYRIYPRPVDRLRDALGWSARFKEFCAVKDVSFEIRPAEFWGIVGKNGSGKSTLLKIVAGQLQPTSGYVKCEGQIALLQLGLGFDPELTGLENIKHSRLLQNLESDYDEIVHFVRDFSEIGDFINYPVKTYSSGMHSRLAFATAIAGDPDILIADEVLAVGDMNFSQKCLAKMREFKEKGKTVVLVTHDINAVKSFCDHAVWLNDGEMVTIGPAKLVADDFRNFMLYGVVSSLSAPLDSPSPEAGAENCQCIAPVAMDGEAVPAFEQKWTVPNASRRTVTNGKISILKYRFVDANTREALVSLRPGQAIAFEIGFRVHEPVDIHSFGFTVHDRHGMIAAHLNSEFFGRAAFLADAGQTLMARFKFDVPMLADGDYSISLGCSENPGGLLMEKYDYDSTIGIFHHRSPITDRQGGFIVIPAGSFEYDQHV